LGAPAVNAGLLGAMLVAGPAVVANMSQLLDFVNGDWGKRAEVSPI
jgi:hypothetical protein